MKGAWLGLASWSAKWGTVVQGRSLGEADNVRRMIASLQASGLSLV
jgi:hypothetical protein